MSTENASPEDRMMAFVEREEKVVEQQDEDKPSRFGDDAPEPQSIAEEADLEEAAGEQEQKSEEETPEERILRLKHDGVEFEKPESEVIELAQKGYDYIKKTQEVAEERKNVQQLAQSLKEQEQNFNKHVEVQNALIKENARLTAIDEQLGQYQNLDWMALSNEDPVQAQKLFFSYNQLQVQRGQVAAEISKKQQEAVQMQQIVMSKQIELGNTILAKDIPGWGVQLGQELLNLGKEYGATNAELSKVTEPWIVKALYDAQQWKKLQSTKPIVDKKVATASPMVKPGAKDSKNAVNARDKANRDMLRKTGKSDYAAKLIERML